MDKLIKLASYFEKKAAEFSGILEPNGAARLIQRAAQMIAHGLTVQEAQTELVKDGIDPDQAMLAAVAGKILLKEFKMASSTDRLMKIASLVGLKGGPMQHGPVKNHMDAMHVIREASVLYIDGKNVEETAAALIELGIGPEAAVVAAVAGTIIAKDFKQPETYRIGDKVKIRTDGNVEGVIINEWDGKPLPQPTRPELHWIRTERNDLTQWDDAQIQKSYW